jgi:hypothetical protein
MELRNSGNGDGLVSAVKRERTTIQGGFRGILLRESILTSFS